MIIGEYMFKFIYTHKQFQIAVTILAESREEADRKLKTKWEELSELGWDVPHYSAFEATSQIIL